VCWPVQKIMRGKFVYVCELAMKGKRERRNSDVLAMFLT
jgi:hypothetical protein